LAITNYVLVSFELWSDGKSRGSTVVNLGVLALAALWNRAGHYIFPVISIYRSIFFFFSSPNLSGRRLDVYHTSTHGVALVRI